VTEQDSCPECFGRTVMWRGKKLDLQYQVCSRWQEAGHMSQNEIQETIQRVRRLENPSGRFG